MQAWNLFTYNGSISLSSTVKPILLNSNMLLIKVLGSSINPLDIMMKNGYGQHIFSKFRQFYSNLMSYPIKNFPLTLGKDFVGLIVDTGTNSTSLINKNVWGTVDVFNTQGSLGEYVVVPQQNIATLPDNYNPYLLSSLPYTSLTVMSSLTKNLSSNLRLDQFIKNPFEKCQYTNLDETFAKICVNKKILIRAGSGGIGIFATQFFRAYNAKSIVNLCSLNSLDLLESLGSDYVINYMDPHLLDKLRKMDKFDLVYDAVGDSSKVSNPTLGILNIEDFIPLLKPSKNSRYICIASPLLRYTDRYGISLGLAYYAANYNRYLFKALSNGGTRFSYAFYSPNQRHMEKLTELVQSGKIKPIVDKVFDFENVPEAYEYFTDPKRSKMGKVVITNYPT